MRILFSLALVLILAQPATAASWFDKFFSPGKKTDQAAAVETAAKKTAAMEAVFSEKDKEVIKEYFKKKAMERLGKGTAEAEADEADDDDGSGRGKGNKGGKAAKKGKGKSKQLPPGLAKKDTLPPGLAKQLEKNGTLPPGLAKRELPDDLAGKLSSPGKGTERVVVDDDVVLVEQATGKVLDILKDVILGPGTTTEQ